MFRICFRKPLKLAPQRHPADAEKVGGLAHIPFAPGDGLPDEPGLFPRHVAPEGRRRRILGLLGEARRYGALLKRRILP